MHGWLQAPSIILHIFALAATRSIRPLRILAVEALEKVKDVEVLRPHAELFARLKTDRDGLISYNSGVILDKLEAAAAQMDEEAWAGKE